MDNAISALTAILGAIIAVAIIAVLVSKNSRTPEAIGAFGSFFSRVIRAAVDPASTAMTNGNPELGTFSLPTIGGGMGGALFSGANFGGILA